MEHFAACLKLVGIAYVKLLTQQWHLRLLIFPVQYEPVKFARGIRK